MNRLCKSVPGLIAATVVTVVQGHHSFAMFDNNTTLTLNGTLYAVEFVNPHGWVWIKAPDAKGDVKLWGLEGGATADLRRQGYDKSNLVVGTKVVATYNPLRDGRNGGRLRKLEFPDGRPVGKSSGGSAPIPDKPAE